MLQALIEDVDAFIGFTDLYGAPVNGVWDSDQYLRPWDVFPNLPITIECPTRFRILCFQCMYVSTKRTNTFLRPPCLIPVTARAIQVIIYLTSSRPSVLKDT